MIVHIDYLTIRIPAFIAGAGIAPETRRMARDIVRSEFPDKISSWILNRDFVIRPPKNGHAGIELDDKLSICLKYGGPYPYVWIELPGRACQQLEHAGFMLEMLQWCHSHVRRIDIACDIGQVNPVEFVAAGYSSKFSSSTRWNSKDGVTIYIGSMKSERYCRVYRYNPPHPRAGVTRVEYVYQGDAAPALAGYIKEHGIKAAVTGLGKVFDWHHRAWKPDNQTFPSLPIMRQRSGDGARIRWIYQQAIPGIAKAVREGLISREEIENAIKTALKD